MKQTLLGFYLDKQLLENNMKEIGELDEGEEMGFSFLEEFHIVDNEGNECIIPRTLNELTMEDFLHGFCHIFSLRLYKEYGYKVENLYTDEGNLIHSYCRTPDGGYVDIRGITYDPQAFFDEFADWLDPMNPYLCRFSKSPAPLKNEGEEKLYRFTEFILRDHASCYLIA